MAVGGAAAGVFDLGGLVAPEGTAARGVLAREKLPRMVAWAVAAGDEVEVDEEEAPAGFLGRGMFEEGTGEGCLLSPGMSWPGRLPWIRWRVAGAGATAGEGTDGEPKGRGGADVEENEEERARGLTTALGACCCGGSGCCAGVRWGGSWGG